MRASRGWRAELEATVVKAVANDDLLGEPAGVVDGDTPSVVRAELSTR